MGAGLSVKLTTMGIRPHIVILAAGQGKRMYSDLPKVLHKVLYRPMLHYVLDLAQAVPHETVSLIVGHGEEQVRAACEGYSGVGYFRQEKQLGTGHAVLTTRDFLKPKGGSVLVLSGDVPLLKQNSIDALLAKHVQSKAAATVLTAQLPNPKGYGRILRDVKGQFSEIREDADCGEQERAVMEVNAGIYCFDGAVFWDALAKVTPANKQGEFYLTDVIALLRGDGGVVQTSTLQDAAQMMGINDRMAAADVEGRLRAEINLEWMKKGVTIEDPEGTWIDALSKLGRDVRIESGCRILASTLADGVVVEAGSRITASEVGAGSIIKQGSYIERSKIGPDCQVGPYAHLRPDTALAARVKIGNFVELKKSTMGEGSKASHLSYIGDAEIGKDVNLGCGFITCNFDGGPKKHRTVIEDEAFIGSDSQMVAPVTIGRGAYVGSGSTITKNVPADALAVTRAPQQNREGYAARLRKRNKKSE